MQPGQIVQLLKKSNWTPEETQWVANFLEDQGASEVALRALMQQLFFAEIENGAIVETSFSEKMLSNIHQRIGDVEKKQKSKKVNMFAWKLVAACALVLLFLSTWLRENSNSKVNLVKTNVESKKYQDNEVQPGSDKAILTLADGSTIVLESASNGALTQQGGTKVVKINGKLDYNASDALANQVLYNTISTPRGGQYQVKLPDGSQVWLNAASSLRFPTVFSGKERIVEVTGEAYFEVASLKIKGGEGKSPFIVKIITPSGESGQVEVVGTHFNINAYLDDSSIKTTLLEGAVNYVFGGDKLMILPGQQSQLTKNGQMKVISGVDLENVLAWKNGIFDFQGLDFVGLAKQLSRWYDVEVIYDGKVNDLFYAQIPRNTALSGVLKALELTGKVKFEIKGKKIIVTPLGS